MQMNREFENKTLRARPHVINLNNREVAGFTGVQDLESFSDTQVVMVADPGVIILHGRDLHIAKLDLDEGQLVVEGYICAVEYDDGEARGKSGGLFGRLFR
jgi:sporulation protein YabP